MFYVRFNVDLSACNTVIATQIVCTFPLVTAIVAAQLFRFQRVQEEAAIDLGCSRMQVLRYIILPHIAPALAAGAIFAFTWSFNNYEISAFTIGFQQTFPMWVYSQRAQPRSHGRRQRDLHGDLDGAGRADLAGPAAAALARAATTRPRGMIAGTEAWRPRRGPERMATSP